MRYNLALQCRNLELFLRLVGNVPHACDNSFSPVLSAIAQCAVGSYPEKVTFHGMGTGALIVIHSEKMIGC